MASLGYQPPLFECQEEEVVLPSFRANLRHCRNIWWQVSVALLCFSLQAQRQANHRRTPAPGQKVCLSARDLPLQVESRKLAPRVVGLFEVKRMVNQRSCHPPQASSIHEVPPDVPRLMGQACG